MFHFWVVVFIVFTGLLVQAAYEEAVKKSENPILSVLLTLTLWLVLLGVGMVLAGIIGYFRRKARIRQIMEQNAEFEKIVSKLEKEEYEKEQMVEEWSGIKSSILNKLVNFFKF
jgi:hypothetical protein